MALFKIKEILNTMDESKKLDLFSKINFMGEN